ncbi:MAG: 2-C-methyl-D-erythritol 4-phosphate cytidylyltransferase, partial [Gemmatimonadales bacterium]
MVVVAAGRGVRAGGGVPKQFRDLAGMPLLLRALRPFSGHPEVAQV